MKGLEWLKEEIWKQDIVMNKGYIYTDDLMSIINEVDEPEVLSQEWIRNNQERKGVHFFVNVTKLQNLLVPKQELPVVPKYVADWIKEERGAMSNWKLPSRFISDSKYKKDQRRYKWSQVEGNMDKFMSALINSYEVEEEQKYCVNDGKNILLCKWKSPDGWKVISTVESVNHDLPFEELDFRLTEHEIKEYDPRYWAFRKISR